MTTSIFIPQHVLNSTQIDTRHPKERRPEIIKLEKEKRKLARKLRTVNLKVQFDNDTVTILHCLINYDYRSSLFLSFPLEIRK